MNFWANPVLFILWLVIGLMPVADAQQQAQPIPAVAQKTMAIVEVVHAFFGVHSNHMSTMHYVLQTHHTFTIGTD